MPKITHEQNKARLLEGFDLLLNQRNYEAAKRYWSPHYIQHSAHIPPGREGLFNLVKENTDTSAAVFRRFLYLVRPAIDCGAVAAMIG